MKNYFLMDMEKREIDAISNLGLAHMGDGVYELLCRSYLCAQGGATVKRLHKEAVELVRASAQAKFAEKPQTDPPETEAPSPDVGVDAPADTYEEWIGSLPPEITEGCSSLVSGSASMLVICAFCAFLIKKKKSK